MIRFSLLIKAACGAVLWESITSAILAMWALTFGLEGVISVLNPSLVPCPFLAHL